MPVVPVCEEGEAKAALWVAGLTLAQARFAVTAISGAVRGAPNRPCGIAAAPFSLGAVRSRGIPGGATRRGRGENAGYESMTQASPGGADKFG
jgi:hypothetical protein